MTAARRLWPLLLMTAAIAGTAIVWATFSSIGSPAASPEQVGQSKIVAVAVGDIRSVVVLSGIALPAKDESLRAPSAGHVTELLVAAGSQVKDGELVARIHAVDGDSVDLRAQGAGTLLEWTVHAGDDARAGDTLAVVAPARFDAAATIQPELLYRFYDKPLGISVKLDHGPAPFDCPLISLGANVSGTDANAAEAPVEIRCSIPEAIRVFSGVRLKLAAVTGESKGALLLPLEAVAGEADQGYVTIVGSDGTRSRRSVRLGLTDGIRIQILDGLSAGDRVLVPPDVIPQDILSP